MALSLLYRPCSARCFFKAVAAKSVNGSSFFFAAGAGWTVAVLLLFATPEFALILGLETEERRFKELLSSSKPLEIESIDALLELEEGKNSLYLASTFWNNC